MIESYTNQYSHTIWLLGDDPDDSFNSTNEPEDLNHYGIYTGSR